MAVESKCTQTLHPESYVSVPSAFKCFWEAPNKQVLGAGLVVLPVQFRIALRRGCVDTGTCLFVCCWPQVVFAWPCRSGRSIWLRCRACRHITSASHPHSQCFPENI